jgi:glycosyltransferase involved in cell wall biosynthesis
MPLTSSSHSSTKGRRDNGHLGRVVQLSSVHPAFEVRMFHKESKALARAGYELSVIVPHERSEVVDKVRIIPVPKLQSRIARMTVTVFRVWQEAVRANADIYHFHDPELILVGLLLRAYGKKVIYDVREDLPRNILSKYYLPKWVRRPVAWFAEFVETAASPAFSAIAATTPTIAKRFSSRNSKTVVIHNFPFVDELAPLPGREWSDRSHSVAHVGYVMEQRGIREMVVAMGLLPPHLQARLILAGGFDSELSDLRREVASLQGWQRVDALGPSDRCQVAAALRNVRAGLLVYHPVPNYIRALPTKMYEYMAAGIPVIASDFPLWREIIEEFGCGVLVDPLDPQSIARAVEFVLTHPAEASAMGRRGREAVERFFNWETEEKKLVQLYTELSEPGYQS